MQYDLINQLEVVLKLVLWYRKPENLIVLMWITNAPEFVFPSLWRKWSISIRVMLIQFSKCFLRLDISCIILKSLFFCLLVLIFLISSTWGMSLSTNVFLLFVTCFWSYFGSWSEFYSSSFIIQLFFCWLSHVSPISEFSWFWFAL